MRNGRGRPRLTLHSTLKNDPPLINSNLYIDAKDGVHRGELSYYGSFFDRNSTSQS